MIHFKGICVCDIIHTGLSCGINQSILYDGNSIDEDLEHGDVRYFLVKLNESELADEKVSFDIVKSDNLGLLYFCTSFEESPGKFTGSDWDCRFACPPNISDPDEEPDVEDYPFFENVTLSIPEGEDHSFFRIAVYTGNYEKIKVSVNNLRISYAAPDATDLHSNSPIQTPTMTESQTHSNSPIQTPSPSIIITTFPLIVNKFPTLSIICLAFVGVFIIVSFTIIVVILMKKKRVGEIKSSINEKLIDNKDASAF